MYLYIIVIGWLYVVVLMAATEKTLTAAMLTFLGYGLGPVVLIVLVFGVAARRRRGSGMPVGEESQEPDRADSQHNQ